MSTRSVIARKTANGFSGAYHHWDGYPEGLGATLFAAYNGHFKKDLGGMMAYLIDQHPAGWSTIVGADFSKRPGYDAGEGAPQCYCHGARSEKGHVYTEKNASGSGCEWAYVFDSEGGKDKMAVYSSYCPEGAKMIGAFGEGDENAKWFKMAEVDLNAPEPDWEAIHEAEPAERS